MKSLIHDIRLLKYKMNESIPVNMFMNIRETVNSSPLFMGMCQSSYTMRNAKGEITYKNISVGSFHHSLLYRAINFTMKGYMRGPVK